MGKIVKFKKNFRNAHYFQAVLNSICLTLVIFFHETMVILCYLLFFRDDSFIIFYFQIITPIWKMKVVMNVSFRYLAVDSKQWYKNLRDFFRVFRRSAFCFLTPRDSKCWVRFLKNFTSAIIVGMLSIMWRVFYD